MDHRRRRPSPAAPGFDSPAPDMSMIGHAAKLNRRRSAVPANGIAIPGRRYLGIDVLVVYEWSVAPLDKLARSITG